MSEEALATKLKGDIDGGADFAALAKEHSEDPKAKETGGAMGTLNLQQLPPMLKDPVSKAKDGDVVGPIDLMGKFAVIKVNKVVSSVTPFRRRERLFERDTVTNRKPSDCRRTQKHCKIEQDAPEAKEEAKPAEAKPAEAKPAKPNLRSQTCRSQTCRSKAR